MNLDPTNRTTSPLLKFNSESDLNLSLFDYETPFALTDREQAYSPDDWAWLFLCMNKEYRAAYLSEQHRTAPVLDSPILLTEPQEKIKLDHKGDCAARFGLSAWIHPIEPRLPPLKEGASWFFPLKRHILEDYWRTQVSEARYYSPHRSQKSALPKTVEFPHVMAEEGLFGYNTVPSRPTAPRAAGFVEWGLTWAAIDCSIAPEGQLFELGKLAASNRRLLREYRSNEPDKKYDPRVDAMRRVDLGEFKTHDICPPIRLFHVHEPDAFAHMKFMRAGADTRLAPEIPLLWRAVCIDVLGPIGLQIEGLSQLLKQVHKELISKNWVQQSPISRIKHDLPHSSDRDGEIRCGGNYLKAVSIVTELDSLGYSTTQIAEITGTSPRDSTLYANTWRRDFHNNIEKYVEDGKVLIEGGYRWLIHSQKPSI
jgi:hypothetical protein